MGSIKLAVVPVTAFQQNCSLLVDVDTGHAAVVDPGGDSERILALITQHDLRIDKILITHGHVDHVGGALSLKEALSARQAQDVPIIGPDLRDAFLMQQVEASAARFGLPGLRNVQPDTWLTEGDVVELGSLRFDVLHCPGHSPGHVVYVEATQRFALVGDVLFRGSVGRTDFPYGDHDALIGAIRDKLLPLGDDITFVCGHGPGSSFGAERQTNPFLQGG